MAMVVLRHPTKGCKLSAVVFGVQSDMSLDVNDLDGFGLLVFKLVYELQSAGQVAKQLQTSSSKLTRELNRLRKIFDDDLFYRRQQRLLPTPKAEQLYPQICASLEQIKKLFLPQLPAHSPTKKLTISVSSSVLLRLAGSINQHPSMTTEYSLRIKQWSTSSTNDIRDGKVDIGIAMESIQSQSVSCELLGTSSNLNIVAAHDHPLWESSDALTLERLIYYPFVYYMGPGFHDRIDPFELFCQRNRLSLPASEGVVDREEWIAHLLTMRSVSFMAPDLFPNRFDHSIGLRVEPLPEQQVARLFEGMPSGEFYLIERLADYRRYSQEFRAELLDMIQKIITPAH